ncbi:histidine kinase [Actinomycetes bacterium KLBMP 9759]
MTTPVAVRPSLEWTGRWAMWLLVLLHVPIVWLGPIFTSVGGVTAPGPGSGLAPLLLAVPMHALLLVVSLARARGRVLRSRRVIVVVIAALSVVPMVWFDFDPWAPTLNVVSAAVLLTFRGWLGHALLVVPVGVLAGRLLGSWSAETDRTVIEAGYLTVNVFAGYVTAPYTLFGAAYLVSALDRLRSVRVELTELAVARERLRLSRDLHDLLGQSLSAISLKGDVAIGLVRDGAMAQARGELDELATIARHAATGMDAITHDAHLVSLRAELASAATLLRAGRIELHPPDEPLPPLPDEVDAVLAWTVREGVTNALRHSLPSRVDITLVTAGDGTVRLDIVNDGAAPDPTEDGTGLRGLAGRAAEHGGIVAAGIVDGDRYRLHVELPC